MDLGKINHQIAVSVMGWVDRGDYWFEYHPDVGHLPTWRIEKGRWAPTQDIAQAWMVVEKVRDGRVIIESFPGGWFCKFRRWDGVILSYAEAETVQIAICVAALKSKDVGVEE